MEIKIRQTSKILCPCGLCICFCCGCTACVLQIVQPMAARPRYNFPGSRARSGQGPRPRPKPGQAPWCSDALFGIIYVIIQVWWVISICWKCHWWSVQVADVEQRSGGACHFDKHFVLNIVPKRDLSLFLPYLCGAFLPPKRPLPDLSQVAARIIAQRQPESMLALLIITKSTTQKQVRNAQGLPKHCHARSLSNLLCPTWCLQTLAFQASKRWSWDANQCKRLKAKRWKTVKHEEASPLQKIVL